MPELLDGIDVVVLAVGLFAVGEALYVAAYSSRLEEKIEQLKGSLWMSKEDWKRSWPAWLRATAIGFPFGSIPAGGAEIPTFLSYATEKKLTKYPQEFGKGAIEGVAGPEAANNASVTGALVPLLTLGIPTSATAAILLSAFQNYGIQPGPLLFRSQPDLVWGLIASLYIGNVLLLIPTYPWSASGLKSWRFRCPSLRRHPGVRDPGSLQPAPISGGPLNPLCFRLVRLCDAAVEHPVAPAIIGLILGPLAETQFRRALAISQGDLSVFITQPISAAVLAVSALLLIVPLVFIWFVELKIIAYGFVELLGEARSENQPRIIHAPRENHDVVDQGVNSEEQRHRDEQLQ